jgi:hypothetical protein
MSSRGNFLNYLHQPLVIPTAVIGRLLPYPDTPKPRSLKQRKNRMQDHSVVPKIRRLLAWSNAYGFERLVAIVFRLPEPNDYTVCLTINLRHGLNLVCFLFVICLVDA